MEENEDTEIEEFRKEMADDLWGPRKDDRAYRATSQGGFGSQMGFGMLSILRFGMG